MRTPTKRAIAAMCALGLATAVLTACGSSGDSGKSSSIGSGASSEAASTAAAKIGFILPESLTARYEKADRPLFTAKVKEICSGCEVLYANSDGDAAKQQQQAESMLTQGINVLVMSAVDTQAASAIVASAKAKNVPVIAYDRFINSPDLEYFISFDNQQIGKIQAESLIEEMKARGVKPGDGGILMLNGAPDDSAKAFKVGAQAVLDASGYKILATYDTPGWDPAKAQDWVTGQITQFGAEIKGIYSMNDGMTGGAIAALKGAGVTDLPPITGQDAENAALQRILAGEQFMTIYRAVRVEAERAAGLAIDLTNGKKQKADATLKTSDGDDTPSIVLAPVKVTANNIQDTVVSDGFSAATDICTSAYAEACAKWGVK
ncbi:sugar ABC transporter substrate-binding protein [Nakamurella antarctica]|uniref:Sugar ABC transporter substrate-binding protein n=1 Tax=Nakamurella antarctica TaxID=1902245 RepID=A0A3G8ZV82_9ACTN|nr:substrate-binding domain-containing protein [Nakamurella antarctica]AZI57601.1 sugar ABC transporter substrate-binding protein [Nakamurella antarctica]